MRVALLLVTLLSALLSGVTSRPVFSGNANGDFLDSSLINNIPRNRHARFVEDKPGAVSMDVSAALSVVAPDVEMPTPLASRVSGWDIERVWMQYDAENDALHIGVACFGICGDADGDGDEGGTSSALAALGGDDYSNLARGEGVAVLLDLDMDADQAYANGVYPWDLIIGVPSGQPEGASVHASSKIPVLECSVDQVDDFLLNSQDCFGLYHYHKVAGGPPGHHFLKRAVNAKSTFAWPVVNQTPLQSANTPDLEWTIELFSELREQQLGKPVVDRNAPFSLFMQAWAGSNADDGIYEDYLPSETGHVHFEFPCLQVDQCGVCLGDGSSCLDCLGVVDGTSAYDACGVCAGDDSSCSDCAGVIDGTSVYDQCDVCDGDNTACLDCNGVVFGSDTYDACDVCGGSSQSCRDCLGRPNGPAFYDECGVCNGDGSTCCGAIGKPCCVNYCGVPDEYWDYILLPVTLDNLIEKFEFTSDIFEWLGENLPAYELVKDSAADLHVGRMAEFNRLFLEECLEGFCEASGVLYSQLVFDNSA